MHISQRQRHARAFWTDALVGSDAGKVLELGGPELAPELLGYTHYKVHVSQNPLVKRGFTGDF